MNWPGHGRNRQGVGEVRAGDRRVDRRIDEAQLVPAERGDRDQRDETGLRPVGIHAGEGDHRDRAPEAGQDHRVALGATSEDQDREREGETVPHGPLPIRFTSATWFGWSGSISRMFTQSSKNDPT